MMRRLFLVLVLLLQLTTAVAYGQIQFRKSAFTLIDSKVNTWIPAAALNTQTGETLVIWTRSFPQGGGEGVLGRFLNAKGISIRKKITIINDPQADGASVTYNPIMNEFLLVYQVGINDLQASLMVLRLNPDGKPLGTAINITSDPITMPYWNEPANVSFNPKTGGYAVVWYLHGHPAVANDSFPMGLLLTKNGTAIGRPQRIITGLLDKRGYTADIAYLPSGNKLLMMYRVLSEDRTQLDYWLGTLDPMLENLNPSNFTKINSTPVNNEKRFDLSTLLPAMAFPSAVSGIVYYPATTNTKVRSINAGGKLVGTSTNAFKSPKTNSPLHLPSVAFTMTSKGMRGILIGTEDEDPSGAGFTWAQVLDQNGIPIGSPIQINVGGDSDALLQAGEIIVLPGKPTDKVFHFVWFASFYNDPLRRASIVKFNLDFTP